MSLIETIILAIVEGLTEFLPVSSTGHMIITRDLLGMQANDPFINAFIVIIQFGAILSVVTLYWKRFFRLDNTPMPEGTPAVKAFIHRWNFYWKLLVAFIPAAVIGLLANHLIEKMLGSVIVVAVMLVVGGIFMLFCDRIFNHGQESTSLTDKKAFMIGVFQCIAMIPGVSRSMATIVGGMAQGLTRKRAAEFSFFLAVPTMFAATCLDVFKLIKNGGVDALSSHVPTLLLGSAVAFVVALLAMKWFVNFLTKYGFKVFGVYRIIVGGFILVWLMMGHSLAMVD